MNREQLIDEAQKLGIKTGRLEMAMIKTPGRSEKLAREKELYLAFVTSVICEKSREGNLIYTGRSGHLLLPGVGHRLRVGLTAPMDARIKRTAMELNISTEKAANHLAQLDEDIGKWIRFVHKADDRDFNQFDVIFNLENICLPNAAGVICNMAELPDFQATPASTKRIEDLLLASQARVRLAMDERTSEVELQVQADNGLITVTYPPHNDQVSGAIPQVLENFSGCRGIECTMAETNILWVQERFTPESETFEQIIHLSQRWGAAVEMLRLVPPDEPDEALPNMGKENEVGFKECREMNTGGVEDDDPTAERDDGGLGRTREVLVDIGRSGGQHSVRGGYDKILERVQSDGHYALVVIGNMFLSKGHSTRTRQTRELIMNIRDRLKAPVISADELQSRFLFGKRQAALLIGFLAVVFLIYALVFNHQSQIFNMQSGKFHTHHKWLFSAFVVMFVPFIAYIYGKVSELILKMINID